MNFCPLKSLTYLASLAKLNESFSVILKHRNIVFIFVWQNLCHGLANCDQFNFQISQNGRFERILLFPTQILSFLLPYFMLKFIQYFLPLLPFKNCSGLWNCSYKINYVLKYNSYKDWQSFLKGKNRVVTFELNYLPNKHETAFPAKTARNN